MDHSEKKEMRKEKRNGKAVTHYVIAILKTVIPLHVILVPHEWVA